jgi:hypothetical protein
MERAQPVRWTEANRRKSRQWVRSREGGEERERLTACTIEQPVSSLDGVVDNVSADGIVDLPQSEANLGHIIAAIELDVGNHVDRS